MRIDPSVRSVFTTSLLSAFLLLFFGCASNVALESQPLGSSSTDVVEEASRNPNYIKLLEVLKGHGYEGAGLQYESDATLQLLSSVFSDPRTGGRDLKQIYTGVALAYDSKNKSLTVGGTLDKEVIVKFIERSVPPKTVPPPTNP